MFLPAPLFEIVCEQHSPRTLTLDRFSPITMTLRPLIAGVAAALILGLPGCGDPSPGESLSLGKAALDKGDLPTAVIQFKNAVAKDPNQAEARFRLGATLRTLGEFSAAEIELRKAMDLGFDPPTILAELMACLVEAGKADAAIELANQRAAPLSGTAKAETVAIKGDALFAKKMPREARLAYEEALALDAGNPTAHFGLARMSRPSPETIKDVQEVLDAHPKLSAGWLLLGYLLVGDGNSAEAEQAFEKALALRPNDIRSSVALFELALVKRDASGARKRLDKLKGIAPGAPRTSVARAQLFFLEGQLLEARAAAQDALKYAPDDPVALRTAAQMEFELSNYAMAARLLQQLVAADPDQADGRSLLASALLNLGQIEDAEKAIAPLLVPESSDARALRIAAEISIAQKNPAKAQDLLRRVIKADPLNPEPRVALSRLLARQRNVQQALAELQEAAAKTPNSAVPDLEMVSLHLAARQPDQALAAAKRAQQKDARNPAVELALGTIHLGRGEEAEARQRFEASLALDGAYLPALQRLAQMDVAKGNVSDARSRYRKVLDTNPRNESVAAALLDLMVQSGASPSEIHAFLADAVRGNPVSARLHLLRIDRLMKYGGATQAMEAALAADAAVPGNPAIVALLGQAQAEAGQRPQALTTFTKLSALQPKSAKPLLQQARVHALDKNWRGAKDALSRARALEPNNPAPYLGLVSVLAAEGNRSQAREVAKQAQGLFKRQPEPYEAEAQLLAETKDWSGAESALRLGLANSEHPSLAVRLMTVLRNAGKDADAVRFVDEWIKKHPGDSSFTMFVADAAMRRSDFREAERWYRATIAIDKKNSLAMNNLAWLLGREKSPEAVQFAAQAVALAPTNPAILDTAGSVYLAAGQTPKALELLSKAWERMPTSATVGLNYAKALIASGRKDEARDLLQKVEKLPSDSTSRATVAQLLSTLQ